MNREALRQQHLVRALWRDDSAVLDLLRTDASPGLAAYRSNAGAMAERALAAAYPTLAALIGNEPFAALARHLWHERPPQRGDLGLWGEALPDFIAASPQLADEPYLADSARLDWALHLASRAADGTPPDHPALDALATDDPSCLHAQLAPGAAVVASAWPIVTVWRAHHGSASVDDARAALAARRSECAFIWRDDAFAVQVEPIDAHDAAFTAALSHGHSLAAALDAAGSDFAFDGWLARALGARWLFAFHSEPATDA
jgi:hypothetical protein